LLPALLLIAQIFKIIISSKSHMPDLPRDLNEHTKFSGFHKQRVNITCSLAFKGPSIYDVHKKVGFYPPPSKHMRPHEPDPRHPLWTSTCHRHEIHNAR